MRPLRYSIHVTLDGGCDHRVFTPDEELHRYATATLERADALLLGRVTYEMMEAAFRSSRAAGLPERTALTECQGRSVSRPRRIRSIQPLPCLRYCATW